jgi:hypothetical protein
VTGARAIPIEDEVSGECTECPIKYVAGGQGDARLRLMAHTKQSGHRTRVRIHSITEFVPT